MGNAIGVNTPTVRAKFICTRIQEGDPARFGETADHKMVHFQAVTDGSDENKNFAKFTPWATASFTVSKETLAAEQWKEGQEYYFDVIPAYRTPVPCPADPTEENGQEDAEFEAE